MRIQPALWVVTVLLAAVAGANEPWKEKPFSAWSDSDIHKVLEDSPWANTITVSATWLRKGAQGPEVGIKTQMPPPPTNPDRREDPDLSLPPAVHDKLYEQFARFLLRWESSRSVRAASQLSAAQSRSMGGAFVDPKLAPEPEEYELLLIGDPLAPFPIATESELKANTILKSVSSGRKLSPSRVVLTRRDDGQILSARFFFRMTIETGQRAFSASDKAIQFECFVGRTLLRVRFEPAKMIDMNGLDMR